MDLGSVDAECPDCHAKMSVKVADIAKERTVTCPNGHSIDLKDGGGGAKRVQKDADDLERKMRDIGKS